MTMSDSLLPIADTRFDGSRVGVHPNGTNTVFVDARQNSANGDDDDPSVFFIRFRGKDYGYSGNWTREPDGVWSPLSDDSVTLRGSFGMSKAPKTYAANILTMIATQLEVWYNIHGQDVLNEAEVRLAEIALGQAEDAYSEAQAVLEAAEAKLAEADRRLTAAKLARISLRAPSA